LTKANYQLEIVETLLGLELMKHYLINFVILKLEPVNSKLNELVAKFIHLSIRGYRHDYQHLAIILKEII
jgi:hypothetical protein